ncbi:MAG: hypothetical protein KGI27_08360 [Thaumarchaeota archaeon]|nr:hypothetical protein [Nitrososphaerota archaeon]
MKKPKSAKKKNAAGAIIAVIVVIAVSVGIIYFYNQKSDSQYTQWAVTSGPFSINNSTYRLGDYVFMTVTGLKPTDVGKIVVFDPKGGMFTQAAFNGTMKSDFNYMFKPNTEKIEKLCTPQDLVGNWTIDFQGTQYRSISFQVINKWVEGAQAEIKAINPC